jgi:hypothetical protein
LFHIFHMTHKLHLVTYLLELCILCFDTHYSFTGLMPMNCFLNCANCFYLSLPSPTPTRMLHHSWDMNSTNLFGSETMKNISRDAIAMFSRIIYSAFEGEVNSCKSILFSFSTYLISFLFIPPSSWGQFLLKYFKMLIFTRTRVSPRLTYYIEIFIIAPQ